MNRLINGDCVAGMESMPAGSADLIIADPPYGLGLGEWDKAWKLEGFHETWIPAAARVLRKQGVMYVWCGSFAMAAQLMSAASKSGLHCMGEIVWAKTTYRPVSWANPAQNLRTWFRAAEYCLHFVKGNDPGRAMERINSDPASYAPLKLWWASELKRLGITLPDVERRYTEVTGRKPYMVSRHWFRDSQFKIPTRAAWDSVLAPMGFSYPAGYDGLRSSYDALKGGFEALRADYEAMRYTHVHQGTTNVFVLPPVHSARRIHVCEKPSEITDKLVAASSRPGDLVLEPFAGSASGCLAAYRLGRTFTGFETDPESFRRACARLEAAGAFEARRDSGAAQ